MEKANILEEGQAEGAEAAVYVSIALKKVPENISHKPVKMYGCFCCIFAVLKLTCWLDH